MQSARCWQCGEQPQSWSQCWPLQVTVDTGTTFHDSMCSGEFLSSWLDRLLCDRLWSTVASRAITHDYNLCLNHPWRPGQNWGVKGISWCHERLRQAAWWQILRRTGLELTEYWLYFAETGSFCKGKKGRDPNQEIGIGDSLYKSNVASRRSPKVIGNNDREDMVCLARQYPWQHTIP